MNTICPCGSQLEYLACCGSYHQGKDCAKTPEVLMRSRYAAYTMANMVYIQNTMRGKPLLGFDPQHVATWAKSVFWLGLKVQQAYLDTTDPNRGFVEFVATYLEKSKIKTIHELSEFQFVDGQWFYIDGEHIAGPPSASIPRNAPCPCGSKKKFKNCHATH